MLTNKINTVLLCNILTNKREITSDATGVTTPTTSGGFGQ